MPVVFRARHGGTQVLLEDRPQTMLSEFQIATCAAWEKLASVNRAERYLSKRGEPAAALGSYLNLAATLPASLLVEAEEKVKLRLTSPCVPTVPGKVAPIVAALGRAPACCLRGRAISTWLAGINLWWAMEVDGSHTLPPRPTRSALKRLLMRNRYNRLPLILAFEEAVLDWTWQHALTSLREGTVLSVNYRSTTITALRDSLSPF
jgi:hypothetical protein